MRITFQPEPGSQILAKWLAGSSGLPIATTRHISLVARESTASNRLRGTPDASSIAASR
jgi:hypothetical protein